MAHTPSSPPGSEGQGPSSAGPATFFIGTPEEDRQKGGEETKLAAIADVPTVPQEPQEAAPGAAPMETPATGQQEPLASDVISVGSSEQDHIPYGQYPVHGDLVDGLIVGFDQGELLVDIGLDEPAFCSIDGASLDLFQIGDAVSGMQALAMPGEDFLHLYLPDPQLEPTGAPSAPAAAEEETRATATDSGPPPASSSSYRIFLRRARPPLSSRWIPRAASLSRAPLLLRPPPLTTPKLPVRPRLRVFQRLVRLRSRIPPLFRGCRLAPSLDRLPLLRCRSLGRRGTQPLPVILGSGS